MSVETQAHCPKTHHLQEVVGFSGLRRIEKRNGYFLTAELECGHTGEYAVSARNLLMIQVKVGIDGNRSN